jgi:hypothetical protein
VSGNYIKFFIEDYLIQSMISRRVIIPVTLLAAAATISPIAIHNAFATVQDCFNLNAPGGISGAEKYGEQMQSFIQNIGQALNDQGVKNVPDIKNFGDLDAFFKNNWKGNDNVKTGFDVALNRAGLTDPNYDTSMNTCLNLAYGFTKDKK